MPPVPLERDGYLMLHGVFSPGEVRAMLAGLESALAAGTADDPAIRGGEGTVYAARNVLRVWPGCAGAWRASRLVAALAAALGPGFGLVRGLYFDKPPGSSWALPASSLVEPLSSRPISAECALSSSASSNLPTVPARSA